MMLRVVYDLFRFLLRACIFSGKSAEMSALSALLCSRKIRNTTRCYYISPPLGRGGGNEGEGKEGNTHLGMNATTLLSFPEFISRCEFVMTSASTTARTTVSSLDEIDFSRAVATPSDLYGAYLGLMRSGLWLECTPICEMFTVGEQEEEEEGGKGKRRREEQQQPPLLCLMCEPNPKPEETKKTNTKNNTTTRNKRDGNVGNGAKRRARAKTKAYAFALNRGVVDETFLEAVANGDGLERLADPSLKEGPEAKEKAGLAALAMEEEKGTAAKLPLKEDEKENERNHRPGREEENVKEEGKEEETAPYESIIVVTIDSDGTTTAMRVSRGFVEPEELRRKEENDDDEEEEENGFLGGGGEEAKNPPKGKKKNNKTKKSIPAGALAFSSSDDDDDLDDEYSE
jgi:hypothetical protein